MNKNVSNHTRKGGVHQWLAGFATGDAISNYALSLQKIARGWGYESEIFCPVRHISPHVQTFCKDWERYPEYANSDNVVIYHFSVGSPLSNSFRTIPDKKILIYHNITPDRYFRAVNPEKALALYQGRQELQALREVPQLALAVSEYNKQELEEMGYKNTGVIPLILDSNELEISPKKELMDLYRDDWINILFVGRITPNKKIDDVIKVFYYYKNTINPRSRLFIVGSFVGMHKYMECLRALTLEMDLPHVIFPGHVTAQELVTYYKLSSLFLCMSEHEGFCMPLLESMYFGIPVIAYAAAAIPETLGGSGVLVYEKDFPHIAELIDVVLCQKDFIIEGQKKRLKDFSREKIADEFHSMLYNFIFS